MLAWLLSSFACSSKHLGTIHEKSVQEIKLEDENVYKLNIFDGTRSNSEKNSNMIKIMKLIKKYLSQKCLSVSSTGTSLTQVDDNNDSQNKIIITIISFLSFSQKCDTKQQ